MWPHFFPICPFIHLYKRPRSYPSSAPLNLWRLLGCCSQSQLTLSEMLSSSRLGHRANIRRRDTTTNQLQPTVTKSVNQSVTVRGTLCFYTGRFWCWNYIFRLYLINLSDYCTAMTFKNIYYFLPFIWSSFIIDHINLSEGQIWPPSLTLDMSCMFNATETRPQSDCASCQRLKIMIKFTTGLKDAFIII